MIKPASNRNPLWLVMRDYGQDRWGNRIGREGKVFPDQCRAEVVRSLCEDPDQIMFVWELAEGVHYDVTEEFLAEAGITDAPFAPMPGIDSADVRKMDMEGV